MTVPILQRAPLSQEAARSMLEPFTELMMSARRRWRRMGGNSGLVLTANPYHLFRTAWHESVMKGAMLGAAAVLRREIAAGAPVDATFAEDTEKVAHAVQAGHATAGDAVEGYLRDLLRIAGLRAADAWPTHRQVDADPVRDTIEALIVEGVLVPDLDIADDPAGFRDLLARCENNADALEDLHGVVRTAVENRTFGHLDDQAYERLRDALSAVPTTPAPMAACPL